MDNLRELFGLDNHYKLVATVSWLFGLALEVVFVAKGAPWTFILSYTALCFVAPYGLKGLTAWLNRRGVEAEVGAIHAEAQAIIERRKSGDGTFEPTE
jgi:hypothetical protein